ncbi:uncharacterized protein At5g08430-like [Gastrolobium bilobum]|uniref:uncharacterized protein At5g08430-like n=1 Tax=Gastrolobium bilobum TaxID=150636 RepID=UPI002AB16BD5|nr:uncharacterized protein At5g08430-like [Gastrolobium bilobum]
MVRKKKRRRKEEIAEDWCCVCKDGGLMRLCDFRDCLKAYHPSCVREDDSLLENGSRWICPLHFCFLCRKAPKFKCFCCPTAVCGSCYYDAEVVFVKGNKGLCRHCSKLAFLIEENADVDSDGVKIDFKDRDTYEGLFSEYYEVIKRKEGLNFEHVYCAHSFFKNGKNKCDLDLDEREDDPEESEDESNFIISDYDDLNDTTEVKSMRKKKKCMAKLKSLKGKVKDKKKEFIGWGSRSLIEFLKHVGRDTSTEFSELDVASIIIEYCKENKLFDPKKKRKILCDPLLRSLLGRKSVNRNNMQKFLAPHFAENFEKMDDINSSSEYRDDNEPFKFSRQRNLISNTTSHQNLFSEECQNCFAAIVSSNIKLVYLKRSLVEELLKQPETFDDKVLGSFVRIKSDPYDYLQKNSYLLSQVIGINRSSKIDEINKEILLQLSNVPKDVPICKISEDDFSEEECQDLHQRMRNGLLKQPTVLELEQKARSLHEDIMKHWIPRELALLQIRINQANLNGRRRELYEYMNCKMKLETPLEQARLLSDIPKVIPEMVDSNMSPEGSTRKGPKITVKENQDGTAIPASVEQVFVYAASQDEGTFERNLLQSTSKARHDNPKPTLFEEFNSDSPTFNPANCGPPQPRNTDSGSDVDGRNLNATRNAVQTIKEKQSISVTDPNEASVNDKQNTSISAIPVIQREVSISAADVIELSDSDEQDANIADISEGIKVVENTEMSIWHLLGPYGEIRGPFSMSVLKRWNETASYPLEFKVWKTGQSEKEAILLTEALSRNFPST